MAKLTKPIRVAADTNVAIDCAIKRESVIDALEVIRISAGTGSLLVPPSVAQELAFIAERGEVKSDRDAAAHFLRNHRTFGFQLVTYLPFRQEFVETVAEHLRGPDLVPSGEIHDSLILAESALLGCSMLLSSDEDLRGVDFEQMSFQLQTFELAAPVVATPREIVRKFFRS